MLKDDFLNRYQCNTCCHSFIVTDREQRSCYSEDYYDVTHANWFSNPNHWLFKFIYSNIIDLTKKRKIRLLDVGCGRGDFLKFIKNMNSEIELYGIDLNYNHYPGINFIKGDFLKDNCNSIKFDIICSLATIEHIEDINLFVNRMKGLLLPGGLIVVTTDNASGIIYKIARILKKIGISTPYHSLYEPAHLQHFTNRSLKMLMGRQGFEIILQKNHNYPKEAVDLPKANLIMKKLYLLGIWIFFLLPKRLGILQTVFCKRKAFVWVSKNSAR